MEMDAEKLLLNAMQDGIRDGIRSRMTQQYQNPFEEVLKAAIAKHGPALQTMVADAIATCLASDEFRASFAEQMRVMLAKQLIQKFGGELEKQVNQLKSDPATRARITLAIDEIIRQKA